MLAEAYVQSVLGLLHSADATRADDTHREASHLDSISFQSCEQVPDYFSV